MKQATITNRVWSIKRQHNMDDDDFLVWMFLRVNSETTITGLYEITPHDMALHLSPKSPSLILEIMQRLQGYGVITYDNGLVFVPDIPFDQNFHSYGHKKSTLAKTRKELGKYRSEIGGKNRAFLAFDAWHEETLAEIAMDEEFEAAHADQDQTEVAKDERSGNDGSSTEKNTDSTHILPPTTPSYPMGSNHYPQVATEEENNKRKDNSNSISELGGGVGEGPAASAPQNPSAAQAGGPDRGPTATYDGPQSPTEPPDRAEPPAASPPSREAAERPLERRSVTDASYAADRSIPRASGAVVGRLTERLPSAEQAEAALSGVVGMSSGGEECTSTVAKAGSIEATTFPPDTEQVRAVMAEYVNRRDVRTALGEHAGRINTAKESLKFLDHYATFRKPAWTKTNNLPVTDWVQAAQHWIREWPRFNPEEEGRIGSSSEELRERSLQDIDREEAELLHALTGDLQ